MTSDPPATLDEPDTDAEVIAKMRDDYLAMRVSLDAVTMERNRLRAENEIKDATLTLIASFAGKCLFSNTRGSDGDQAYREGSHAAWEQAADIAISALNIQKAAEGQ